MEAMRENHCGASLLQPNTSADEFLDAESFVASVTDLLGPPDLDPFSFANSRGMSPKWLDDILSLTHRSPANSTPFTGEEDKIVPVESLIPSASSAKPQTQHCQNPQGLCVSLATALLKSMHAPSPSCLLGTGISLDSSGPQPQLSRPVDIVLSTNYEALRSVGGLLRCPCYTSPQLQLLVTVICAETIAWYWRIIDTYSPHRNSPHTQSGQLLNHMERVETTRRSFFIGDQCLEGQLEAKLISQVVSSRLQELEALVADITWSTGQSATSSGESRSHPMHSAVHNRMEAFLNNQLTAVRRELLNLQAD